MWFVLVAYLVGMRVKRPWFGDRLLGIGGLRPVTWEGWLVAVALVAVAIADGQLIGFHQALGFVVLVVAIAAYAVVGRITSGRWWSWGPFDRHREP